MSTEPAATFVPAVTIQDLELEHAELLPARETLCRCNFYKFYPFEANVARPPLTPCLTD